jgi:protein TonB
MTTFVTVAKSGKKTLNRKTTVQAANAGVSTEAVTEIALKAGVATARSPSPARSEAAAQSGSPGTGDGRDGVQMIADGKPEYPPFSRQLGEEGDVVLRFKIGASGAILDTLLDNSSGFPRLDQSALDFSKTVRFIVTHAMAGPIEKRVTFVFRLE